MSRSDLVLDTHALLWALMEPNRFHTATLERVRDPATRLVVSAASAWEIATKVRLGKLDGARAVLNGYTAHLDRLAARELAISSDDAIAAGSLDWEHRDPFDRIIAAQCMKRAVPLVTADAALTTFSGVSTLW